MSQAIAAAVDRREFLSSKLSSGLALAVLPVSARTVTTEIAGLEAGEVSIPTADTIGKPRAAWQAAGNTSKVVLYLETGHGCNADYVPGCNKEAAGDGLTRLQQWFKKYGAA